MAIMPTKCILHLCKLKMKLIDKKFPSENINEVSIIKCYNQSNVV